VKTIEYGMIECICGATVTTMDGRVIEHYKEYPIQCAGPKS